MIIHKAYKFRLYPNPEQKELINKTFGCNYFIYSYYLEEKQKEYKSRWKGKKLYKIDTYYLISQVYSICGYQNKEKKIKKQVR